MHPKRQASALTAKDRPTMASNTGSKENSRESAVAALSKKEFLAEGHGVS
jgi:hypothetical protein